MRRSEINRAIREAMACFARSGWVLPPNAAWDVTDFGLGDFGRHGLVLVNLAAEPEYCEKLMYARPRQTTPCHAHARKKEDIICRAGELVVRLWAENPARTLAERGGEVRVNGERRTFAGGERLTLPAGWRVTLPPGVWHEFYPPAGECVIGEVSTANDDRDDNLFADANVGRFPPITEDEAPVARLCWEA